MIASHFLFQCFCIPLLLATCGRSYILIAEKLENLAVENQLKVEDILMLLSGSIYVTGFDKTWLLRTKTEIHFIA